MVSQPAVGAIRHLLAQRRLTALLCAATLLLKLLIPTGYMIATDHGRITIVLCPSAMPAAMKMPMPMAMEMPGMHGDMPDHGKSRDHSKVELPCAFAGLSAAMLGAIDPVQLAALIAFLLALAWVGAIPPSPAGPSYLRPPPRGPPAYL